jgi:hypothetical protein
MVEDIIVKCGRKRVSTMMIVINFSGGKTQYILIFPGRKMSMGEK